MSGGDDALIEDSAARLFAGQVGKAQREQAEDGHFDSSLWRQMSDSGFALALACEAAGGIGASWRAAYPILRGLGYWQVPLPLAETMVAAQLLSLAGLPIPDGPLTLVEQGQGNDLRVDGNRLSGTAHRVPWARHAVAVLASLTDGRIALLALRGAPGVTIEPASNHAGLPSDTLHLVQASGTFARNPLPIAQPVWTLGALARSAMMVGALEWVLEQSARYAGERVQFGKPIGKNQAIQQQLALLAGDVAAARVAALVAVADAPDASALECGATFFSTAVAKVRCGEAATRGSGIAHQVHGAIGFTHEHPLHFATRRLWAWREEFGSEAQWAQRLGQAAIAARGAGFWPAVTERSFDR